MSQGPPKRRPPKLPHAGSEHAAPTGEKVVEPPPPTKTPTIKAAAENSANTKASAGTPPCDESKVDIERTRAFLDQAAGIVAVERGINAKSRVKLAAIARGLGLSDAQFDAAMQTLQRGEQEPTLTADELAQLRRRQSKFHSYVGETLMALPQGVLTASMEHMLVTAGVDEFGMQRDDAERDVLALVKKLQIRRITADEAERHIASLADAAINASGRLPDDVRERILLEATRWGMTPDQVTPLLEERVRHARLLAHTRQRRRVVLITAAAALAVAVLGALGILALAYAFPSNRQQPAEVATPVVDGASPGTTGTSTSGDGTTRPMVSTVAAPKWWSDDLELAVALSGARIPSYREDLKLLRSDDEAQRSAGYAQLLANVRREELTRDQHALLTNLMAAAYALEPSETCAVMIRDELLATAGGPSEALSESLQPWESALWAGDTISAALVDDALPDARGAALASAFASNFEAHLERDSPARLHTQVQAAVAARLYATLAAGAKTRPELAIDIHTRLLPLIDTQLDAAARDRLQSDYLAAVLPTLGERWVLYEDLLRRSVYSDDPLNVLKMLELCERTESMTLRNFLATQLTLRTGLATPPRTLPELATAVREALGATESVRPVDAKERLSGWHAAATAALASDPPPASDTMAQLQQAVELARLSTLGAALAQGELGGPEFDVLWREKPVKLKAATEEPAPRVPSSPRVNTTQLKNLDRTTTALRSHNRLSKLQRLNHVRAIKSYAASITDVLPAQGQDIAAYLTAAKAVDEHEDVSAAIDEVLRWRMVRLALADQLADARLRDEHLLELVSKALRREFDGGDGWRERARVALLDDVARELDAASSLAPSGESIENQASAALVSQFRTQAKVAGASASEIQAAAAPSELLLLLVNGAGAKLSASGAPAARRLVEQLPVDVRVADYLATSDLSRSIQLQSLLVGLQAALIQADKSSTAAAVAAVETEFRERDKAATSQLEQLLAGQRALLRLWMIRNS